MDLVFLCNKLIYFSLNFISFVLLSYNASQPQPHPHPIPSFPLLQIHHSSISFQKRPDLPVLLNELGITKCRKTRNTPLYQGWKRHHSRGKCSQKQAKSQRYLYSHCWIQQKLQAKKLQHICRGPGTDPCRRHGCQFSLCETLRALFSWFHGRVLLVSSTPRAPQTPPLCLLLGSLNST